MKQMNYHNLNNFLSACDSYITIMHRIARGHRHQRCQQDTARPLVRGKNAWKCEESAGATEAKEASKSVPGYWAEAQIL